LSKVKELQNLSLATTYEIDDTFDSEKFIKMRLRVCHDGTNPNRSNFEVNDMEKTKDSIQNIPILANVLFDEDGNPQFGGHDMVLEENKVKEGELKLIYKEVPIGLVPETCNHIIEKFNDKNYVFVDAYIWKDYSNYAEDIIERDKDIKLSMEIIIDSYSYNAKDKVYNITDYRYQGITFLNKNYGTGMENALATTEAFEENDSKEKFIMMAEELKNTLAIYNINKNDKGGSTVNEEIIALLKQYNITADELTFSIDGMSIEEVEEKLKEFNSNNDDGSNPENKDDNEPEKFIKSFELSHSDIRYALYKLLSPVETEDSEWYFIDQVYDNHFEYLNWEGTKIYRQGYKKDGDNVEFEADRIELYQERLTLEEKETLDKMRNEYSALEIRLNELQANYEKLEQDTEELKEFKSQKLKLERESQETELFSKYDEILEKDDESYLKVKENKNNFSVEQLEEKLAVIFARKQFSSNKNNIIVKIGGETGNTGDVSPYGNLFEKHLANKTNNKEEI